MAAGKYNFVVEQGTQHDVQFRYRLSDGSYVDLTNYRVRMGVKDHITDTAYVYRATTDSSADTNYLQHFVIPVQTGEDIGVFKLSIPTAVTNEFDFNQGVYDIELVDQTGVVTRLLEGKFKIKLQVTE